MLPRGSLAMADDRSMPSEAQGSLEDLRLIRTSRQQSFQGRMGRVIRLDIPQVHYAKYLTKMRPHLPTEPNHPNVPFSQERATTKQNCSVVITFTVLAAVDCIV